MAVKLVIFDFDGTLADSFSWFTSVIDDVADRYNFKRIAPGEIEALRGKSARDIVRHLGVPPWKMPLIAAHMRRRKAREIGATRLFDGAGRLLRRLSDRGIAIAIASSDAEANVRATLGPDLAALVDRYACGTSLFGKASKFKALLRQTGCAAAEAICIGDELRDLEAARQAGIPFGAVAWGFTTAEALRAHRPDHMFERMDEIVEHLCRVRSQPLARNTAIG